MHLSGADGLPELQSNPKLRVWFRMYTGKPTDSFDVQGMFAIKLSNWKSKRQIWGNGLVRQRIWDVGRDVEIMKRHGCTARTDPARGCSRLSLSTRYEQAHPAQALDADVVGIGSAWRAIDDPVPELIVGSAARHPAEQLTSVLHQNWQRRQNKGLRWLMLFTSKKIRQQAAENENRDSLPLYLGTQRTLGGRPLMLKCFPSKTAHCSSLKSFFCLEQGSELQERNFIRRPTQYIPPLRGLRAQESMAT